MNVDLFYRRTCTELKQILIVLEKEEFDRIL